MHKYTAELTWRNILFDKITQCSGGSCGKHQPRSRSLEMLPEPVRTAGVQGRGAVRLPERKPTTWCPPRPSRGRDSPCEAERAVLTLEQAPCRSVATAAVWSRLSARLGPPVGKGRVGLCWDIRGEPQLTVSGLGPALSGTRGLLGTFSTQQLGDLLGSPQPALCQSPCPVLKGLGGTRQAGGWRVSRHMIAVGDPRGPAPPAGTRCAPHSPWRIITV